MKKISERVRRILAGLVSAMMVLTSLPLTGAAVYAAETDGSVTYEDPAVAEDTVHEAADAAQAEAAVEAVDAVADEPANEPLESDIPQKRNMTFRANEMVKSIKYIGTEVFNFIDMAKARTLSGDTLTDMTNEEYKLEIDISDNAILLPDSVKVNGEEGQMDFRGLYTIPVSESGSVDISVTPYRRVGVSVNNLLGKKGRNLATIFVDQGVTPAGRVYGTDITFTYAYATGLWDYDVTLAEPVVKYGNTVITPDAPFLGIDGIYTIKKSDVEAAIRAGEDIVITAAGTEVQKADLTIKKAVSSDKIKFNLQEYTPENRLVFERYDLEDLVTGTTYEKGVHIGNSIILSGIDAYSEDAFIKVSKGNEDIEPELHVEPLGARWVFYDLGALVEDTVATIKTARLQASEIGFTAPADPDGAVATIEIPDKYLDNDNVKVGELGFKIKVNDAASTLYGKKVKNVKYKIAGGQETSAEKRMRDGEMFYFIPSEALSKAAFADVDGDRITVTATLENTAPKPQKLSVVETVSGSSAFAVQSNGAYISGDGSYDIAYNAKATATVTPNTGHKLEKVYLIKDADKKAASMNEADYFNADKLLEQISANRLAATVVAADSKTGIATVNVAQMDGAYTILVTTSAKEELVIEEDGPEGWTPIHADNKHVYHVSWGRKYRLRIASGADNVILSKDDTSASYLEEESSEVPSGVLGLDETTLKVVTFDGDAVAGKSLMVKLAKSDGGSLTAEFNVSQKPTEDSVKFADGVVSENVIKEAQPLGTSRTYRLTVAPEIAGRVGVAVSGSTTGVEAELVNVTDRKGKITGTDLIVISKAVYPAPVSANIAFHDATTYPDVRVFKTVTVNFSTDQVTNADLSGVTAVADTDSITVDFSKAKGFDRATDDLYYMVTISSNEVSDVLCDNKTVQVPASETSRTISMLKNPSTYDVEPNEITYIVKVELVQKKNVNQIIARSGEQMVSDSVKTISDGVYAKKVKLVKAKTAPKVIYGSYAGVGMDRFLLATAVYPDAAKNVPVTVKRLKRLQLTDSKGNDWSGKVDDKQNSIYLEPQDLPAGKYTLTAYAVEPKGVDVTGTLKFTVANAINQLKVTVPSNELYRAPGKAASIKATVVYNGGNKSDAPGTKKVKWYLTDDHDNKITPPAGMTFKNGVVKIAKNAVLPANYTFRIYAEAADFDHGANTIWAFAEITVTNTERVPAEIYIKDTQITDGAKIESGDLAGEIRVYDQNEERIKNIKATVTGVLKKENNVRCKAVNLGKATVTVTTTDGSKKSKKVKFVVDTDEGINGELDNGVFSFGSSASEYGYINTNDASYTLPLNVYGDDHSFVAHSIKLEGFKKVKVKGAENKNGFYNLTATKRNAKITITANGKSTVINVINKAIPENSKAAAAKITASNKLCTAFGGKVVDQKGIIFGNLNFTSKDDYDTVSYNKVKYTVKYGKTPAKKDEKVRLYTTTDEIADAIWASGATRINDGTYDVALGEGGTFVIDYINADGDFELKPGTYKIQVTPVYADGYASGKSGTIKVKVVNAPKATVKTLKAKAVNFTGTVSANSEADLNFAKQANILITGSGASSAGFGVKILDEHSKPVDLDLRGLNVKGKINGFAQMFEVTDGGTLKYTGTKPSNYNARKGISGQIAVSYTAMNGQRTYMYIPITVKGSFK